MVLGRFREAVSDAAETLRRIFVDPPAHSLDVAPFHPQPGAIGLLDAHILAPPLLPEIRASEVRLLDAAFGREASMAVTAQLRSEQAWDAWSTDTTALSVPPIPVGSQSRLEIPPLPRKAAVRRLDPTLAVPDTRRLNPSLDRPRAGVADPSIGRPGVREDLRGMRAAPVAVQGEGPEALGTARTMRYLLQLVRNTGENARNLELLGLFPIPDKGVETLTHDPRRGCLWLRLGAEAARSRRRIFILARRKDDQTLVSCFAEES